MRIITQVYIRILDLAGGGPILIFWLCSCQIFPFRISMIDCAPMEDRSQLRARLRALDYQPFWGK
jgi:hypothetical protein